MAENFYYKKKKLLEDFKLETLQQLQAIQEENADKFFEKVEKCERIMTVIDELDKQNTISLAVKEKKEIQKVLEEITEIRKQISPLLIPLRNKLKQSMMREKQSEMLHNAYSGEEEYYPSIFFDKKN